MLEKISGTDILAAMMGLIFVYLLLKNAANTAQVVKGLSSGFDGVVSTLQGNPAPTS